MKQVLLFVTLASWLIATIGFCAFGGKLQYVGVVLLVAPLTAGGLVCLWKLCGIIADVMEGKDQ